MKIKIKILEISVGKEYFDEDYMVINHVVGCSEWEEIDSESFEKIVIDVHRYNNDRINNSKYIIITENSIDKFRKSYKEYHAKIKDHYKEIEDREKKKKEISQKRKETLDNKKKERELKLLQELKAKYKE